MVGYLIVDLVNNEIGEKEKYRIREIFIAIIMYDLKERWAGYRYSLEACLIEDFIRRALNQDTKRLPESLSMTLQENIHGHSCLSCVCKSTGTISLAFYRVRRGV